MPLYIKTTLLGGAMRHNFWTVLGKLPYRWPLPTADGQPGAWLDDCETGPLVPHRSGFNLAPFDCFLQYASTENYLAEAEGETAAAHDCVVARRVRLLRKLPLTPTKWRELGYDYATTACTVLGEVDKVRPYLEHNLTVITGAFASVEQPFLDGALPMQLQPQIARARQILEAQISRFAYDEPSSGLYVGPAQAARRGTQALISALELMGMPDKALDHGMCAKHVAYLTGEAAYALADDYVEHRDRATKPSGLAALAGVTLPAGETPDDFPRAVRKGLFRLNNDRLLVKAGLV